MEHLGYKVADVCETAGFFPKIWLDYLDGKGKISFITAFCKSFVKSFLLNANYDFFDSSIIRRDYQRFDPAVTDELWKLNV